MKRRKYYREIKDNVKSEKRKKAVQRQQLFETITKSLTEKGMKIDYNTSNKTSTNINLVTDVYAHVQHDISDYIHNIQNSMPTTTTSTREEYELLDQCGVCNGGIYECNILDFNINDCGTPGSTSWMDCTGICFGSTLVSNCGVCGGIDNTPNTGTCDCAGVPNGTSYINPCGDCVTSATDTCEQDCTGVWGGEAFTDVCGYCVGGTTNYEEGWADSGCGCNINGPVPTYPDMDGDRLGVCLPCSDVSTCVSTYPEFSGEFNEDCIPIDDNNNCCVKHFCMEQNTIDFFVDTLFPLYIETNNYVFNYDDNDYNCNTIESSFPMCSGYSVNAPLSYLNNGQHNCGYGPYLDFCGLCPNNTFNITLDNQTLHQYSYNSSKDCNDDCLGTAYEDECGVCCGGNTGVQCSIGPNQGVKDCYGVCNGGNLEYQCDSSESPGGGVNTFCGCPDGATNCGSNQHVYNQFLDCAGVCFYHTYGSGCNAELPIGDQGWECFNFIKNDTDVYGHCCLTGFLTGDDSEIVTAYADNDNDGVGNTGSGLTIEICSTADEPFHWTSYDYYWTQIGDDCYGNIDDCGVCHNPSSDDMNENMDDCGVCHLSPPCTGWNDGNCIDWNSSCVGCTIVGSVNFNPDTLVACDDNIGSGCINGQTGVNCCCETTEDYLDDNCELSDVIAAGNDDCIEGDVCLPDGYINPGTCFVDDLTGCCTTQVNLQTDEGGPAFCETIGCMNLCYTTNYADPYCCPNQDSLVISDDEVTDGYNSDNYACDNIYYQAWCLQNDFGVGPDYPVVTVNGPVFTDTGDGRLYNANMVTNFSDHDVWLNGNEYNLSEYYTGTFAIYGQDSLFLSSTVNQDINIVTLTFDASSPFELTGEVLSVIAGENFYALYDMYGLGIDKWYITWDFTTYLESFPIKTGNAFVHMYVSGGTPGNFNLI